MICIAFSNTPLVMGREWWLCWGDSFQQEKPN